MYHFHYVSRRQNELCDRIISKSDGYIYGYKKHVAIAADF